MDSKPLFVFPRWSNKVAFTVIVMLALAPTYLITLVAYGLNPTSLNVGYQPVQPIPYSHKLHAGELGIDCRYCHNTVEKAAFAAIPPTDTCMNCHNGIWNNADAKLRSQKLDPLFRSHATGEAIKWVKVHDLPDFVYFNHSAHISIGMSCVECHGNVNHMEHVSQVKPLNMGWCLECHRDPAAKIRPREQVTNLDWKPGPEDESVVKIFAGKLGKSETEAKSYVEQLAKDDPSRLQHEMGEELIKIYHVNITNITDCVMCHR